MRKYIVKKVLLFIPAIFTIITITFFFIRLAPGGPFDKDKNVPPEVLQNLERYYHLDEPLWKQYIRYITNVLKLDLGPSFRKPSYSVREWIVLRLPVSIELGIYALTFALSIGILCGFVSALKQNTWVSSLIISLGIIGICIPNFVSGPLLALFFGIKLDLLPIAGWDLPQQKILPSLALGFIYSAYILRIFHSSLTEVLNKEYIRTAKAKGLSQSRILIVHASKGALQPVVSFLGPAGANLLTGSFVIETIFHIPGLGREFVEATFNRDYTMIMGIVIVYAVLILIFNLTVDIIQGWLDPRISYD
ncbi:MAG: ABC transporter permease subunit [Candidatus Hydrogenedentes bacterium]|nr:ABC transporter permease subunit [Candidatus Hydrogenedentota bacterium]